MELLSAGRRARSKDVSEGPGGRCGAESRSRASASPRRERVSLFPTFPSAASPRGRCGSISTRTRSVLRPKRLPRFSRMVFASRTATTSSNPLLERIARHHDVPKKSVLVGCGSTEFLQFAPWAFLKDGGNIVLPLPTYGWCGGVAKTMGREVIEVPLGPEGTVDAAGLKKAITRDTRMLYIANPNNPTGAGLTLDEIASLDGGASRRGHVLRGRGLQRFPSRGEERDRPRAARSSRYW